MEADKLQELMKQNARSSALVNEVNAWLHRFSERNGISFTETLGILMFAIFVSNHAVYSMSSVRLVPENEAQGKAQA